MNILLLGVMGRTGRPVAQLAHANEHTVTAIIRDKSKATIPGVRFIEGSLTDGELLKKALQGIDAVVVALNINRTVASAVKELPSSSLIRWKQGNMKRSA